MENDIDVISGVDLFDYADHDLTRWQATVGWQVRHRMLGRGKISAASPKHHGVRIEVIFDEDISARVFDPTAFEQGFFTGISVPIDLRQAFAQTVLQARRTRQELQERAEEQRRAAEAARQRAIEEKRQRQEEKRRQADEEAQERQRRQETSQETWAEIRRRQEEERRRVAEAAQRQYEEQQRQERQRRQEASQKAAAERWQRQEEKRRTARERRAVEIQSICADLGITTLCHFTREQNLESILQHGLLSRSSLKAWPGNKQPLYNDNSRLDGQPDAICLSISFPNYRMFYVCRQNSASGNWVVLLLEASVLWALDCAFCLDNAASTEARRIPLGQRKEPAELRRLFEDYKHIRREKLGIPKNCPTNPQAEVLVFEPISPSYIREVQFQSQEICYEWVRQYGNQYPQSSSANQQYFRWRVDWRHWQSPTAITTPPDIDPGFEVDPFWED